MNTMSTENTESTRNSESTITILPELENLLPPLSPEETGELRRSIAKEGIRDNVLVWKTRQNEKEVRILIDGHNRYRAAEALGISMESLPVAEVAFADIEEVKAWIIANQLMRRNLTDEQRRHYRGRIYNSSKAEQGGDRKSSGKSYHLKTAEKLAKQFNVSEKTIRNDAAFAKQVDALPPEDKAAVLAGKKKLPTATPVHRAEKADRDGTSDRAEKANMAGREHKPYGLS